ncbi:MAG TPA: response regulator [Gemmatimonadaceae bacterium]|nr:response regulator [Gemmatimonadaceae bacterium]
MQSLVSGAHGRILVIDDTAIARTTLEALLLQEGHEVLQAADGTVGLELARLEQPDAIVLDIMMPGIDGLVVCSALRANRITAHIPILMVTALSDDAARRRAILAGADDFLSKPYDRWELRARLGTLVRLGRARHLLVERERLLWVMDRSPVAYGLLDSSDRVRYANPEFRRLAGLGGDATLDVAFRPLLQTRLRTVDPEQWKRFDAWDELCGPIELLIPGIAGQPGRRFELWVHAGHEPGGWRVLEIRPTQAALV